MALNIKDPETDRLARELARETGETITDAVAAAVAERLAAVRRRRGAGSVHAEVTELQAFVAALPVHDDRPAGELPGYDGAGLPE